MSKYEQKLIPRVKEWLVDERGLSEEVIEKAGIGFNEKGVVIPIRDREGKHLYNKYRRNPFQESEGMQKYWFDKGAEAQIYGWEHIKDPKDKLVICEGEFDKLVLDTHNIPAITGTNGAPTFKDEWIKIIKKLSSAVYICMDSDYAGLKATEKLSDKLPEAKIITLPEEEGVKDITDYVKKNGFDKFRELMFQARSLNDIKEEKRSKLWEEGKSKFSPMTTEELQEILELTIKSDDTNKAIVFYCMLSSFTEEDQFNISFNAPSSTGKTYLPLEIASFFPQENVKEIGYCTPTAFYHDGEVNKEDCTVNIDFTNKILIFLDQPKPDLLERLRPILSHDKKVTHAKITDKSKNIGQRTKNVSLNGFPAVIFCSAGLKMDEQEGTRFLLLSPETTQEKLRASVYEKTMKNCDPKAYRTLLNIDPYRRLLMDRIVAIRDAEIKQVVIKNKERVFEEFKSNREYFKPKYSRDISRIISFIKTSALLNLWFRERNGDEIIANEEDINSGFKLWNKIALTQDLNLPPYVYNMYFEVLMPAREEKGKLLERQDIIRKHYKVYGRPLPEWQLNREILPLLEMASMIVQEPNPDDRRKRLIKLVYDNYEPCERGIEEPRRDEIKQSKVEEDDNSIDSGVYIPGDEDDGAWITSDNSEGEPPF